MLSDDELQARTRLIPIDEDWTRDEEELTKGNRRKFVAYPQSDAVVPVLGVPKVVIRPGTTPVPGPWFWKASLERYPLEFWSEVLAYQFGEAMGIGVPPCLPSIYQGVYGSLSQFFVDRYAGEFLMHGGDLFLNFRPDYDRRKGEEHSVKLIRKALAYSAFTGNFVQVCGQLIFDGIIGNGDRHQDNWGILFYPSLTEDYIWHSRVAPTFDNGTSLGRELSETTVEAMLKDANRFEAYINRGKAHAKWEEDGVLTPLMHEDLVARIVRESPELRETAERILGFDLERIRRAVERVGTLSQTCSGVEISAARQELIVRLVARRRERMLAKL